MAVAIDGSGLNSVRGVFREVSTGNEVGMVIGVIRIIRDLV